MLDRGFQRPIYILYIQFLQTYEPRIESLHNLLFASSVAIHNEGICCNLLYFHKQRNKLMDVTYSTMFNMVIFYVPAKLATHSAAIKGSTIVFYKIYHQAPKLQK